MQLLHKEKRRSSFIIITISLLLQHENRLTELSRDFFCFVNVGHFGGDNVWTEIVESVFLYFTIKILGVDLKGLEALFC